MVAPAAAPTAGDALVGAGVITVGAGWPRCCIACCIMPGIIMPNPAPMPIPMAPGPVPASPPSAILAILLAAWYIVKACKSPTAPMLLRASMARCTSSGGVMALMKKSTSSRPYLPNSSLTLIRVPAAISSNLLGKSSMPILDVPNRSVIRATIRSFKNDVTSSVENLPWVPTSSLINSGESTIR